MNLENDYISIKLKTFGAELSSLYNKQTQIEHIWQAGAEWSKHSPVLFPIVGGLKNGEYTFENKTYKMNRHGFAREMEFGVCEENKDSIVFMLSSNEKTKELYPFDFNFFIEYKLVKNKLEIHYQVENKGKERMWFSLGAHPAFNVPFTNGSDFNDYYLQFNETENVGIFPLTTDGLIKENPVPFFRSSSKIELNKELFHKDALVFKQLNSNKISLLNTNNKHGIHVDFRGFIYMGIWSAKDADFVCIEPWCGIADSENHNGALINKEGIINIVPQTIYERTWSIETF